MMTPFPGSASDQMILFSSHVSRKSDTPGLNQKNFTQLYYQGNKLPWEFAVITRDVLKA